MLARGPDRCRHSDAARTTHRARPQSPELLAKFDAPEKRQNYLLMQEMIADLLLRERVALGKQFAAVIDCMRRQSEGYVRAAAHLDSRPEWIFVFGSSKKWARE